MSVILAIEDDPAILRGLADNLRFESYEVLTATDGQTGYALIREKRPDLIILDLMLPKLSGYEICRKVRAEGIQTPILMLTARGEEADRVLGLDLGADDYLTKPFGGAELLARPRVILRRAQTAEETSAIRFGAVDVDLVRRTVTKAGQEVKLTPKEYAFLRLLATHRGKVLTHRQILRELWGPKAEDQTHYLRVHMAHLRQKLEDEPNQPKYFKTESGIGYRFCVDP